MENKIRPAASAESQRQATGYPIITTVIPTYRRPSLLKRAIRSALNQTLSDLIVNVYDNASGDETSAAVEELAKIDPRVSYFCQAENVGIVRNFESGMRGVQTPYFSCLGDDDLLLPDLYQEGVEALKREPSAMFFAATTILANFNGTISGLTLNKWQPGIYHPPAGLYAMIRAGCPNWTSIVFRREVCSEVGFLDQETGTAADDDFLLRIAAKHNFIISKTPGAVFFANPESMGRRTSVNQLLSQRLKTVQNISEFPDEYRAEALRLFEPNLGPRLFVHARRAAINGDRLEALETAKMLERYSGSRAAAAIKLLVMLDRVGLRRLVQFVAAITRFPRNRRSLFEPRHKRKYQQILDKALLEYRAG